MQVIAVPEERKASYDSALAYIKTLSDEEREYIIGIAPSEDAGGLVAILFKEHCSAFDRVPWNSSRSGNVKKSNFAEYTGENYYPERYLNPFEVNRDWKAEL